MAKESSKGNGQLMPKIEIYLELSPEQGEELLNTLKVRFEKNMHRHKGLDWPKIQAKLEAHPEKLASLHAMESTGGEPDVVGYDQQTGEHLFYGCAAESPKGRRSICYDRAGQAEREKKGVHPAGNVPQDRCYTIGGRFPPSDPAGGSALWMGTVCTCTF